jgi:anti-sigma B factor antagonist
MEIKNSKCGRNTVVAVSGELDINTSEVFGKHCAALVQQGEINIVLDFSNLRYLSSAGLRNLLILDRQVRGAGGSLSLCAPSEPTKMVLRISGFLDQIKVYNSVEELPA